MTLCSSMLVLFSVEENAGLPYFYDDKGIPSTYFRRNVTENHPPSPLVSLSVVPRSKEAWVVP